MGQSPPHWPRYDFNGRLGWEIITDSIIWNRFSMSAVRQSAETPPRRQQLRAKLLEKFGEFSELNIFVSMYYVTSKISQLDLAVRCKNCSEM